MIIINILLNKKVTCIFLLSNDYIDLQKYLGFIHVFMSNGQYHKPHCHRNSLSSRYKKGLNALTPINFTYIYIEIIGTYL